MSDLTIKSISVHGQSTIPPLPALPRVGAALELTRCQMFGSLPYALSCV